MTDITQGQDAKAGASAPDVDDLFPKQDVDDLFPRGYKVPAAQADRNPSPVHDFILSMGQNQEGRVLDAFGYGFKQNWGAGQQEMTEADEYMRKAGIWDDYQKGQHSIIKAANEAVMRPAISALVAAKSTMSGVLSGGQAAVAQIGEELGTPKLGHEIAAMPEAFPAGLHQTAGIPHVPEPVRPQALPAAGAINRVLEAEAARQPPPLVDYTMDKIAEAKELNVIGAGEDGYFGTKPVIDETLKGEAKAEKGGAISAKDWNETLLGQKPEALGNAIEKASEFAGKQAIAPAAPETTETPPPQEGYVRFFHGWKGTAEPTSGGGRWTTTDPIYARDFRRSEEEPNHVSYVDIPKGDATEVAARRWDEIDEAAGTNAIGRYHHIEVPEVWAKQMKPYVSEVTQTDGTVSPAPLPPIIPQAIVDDVKQKLIAAGRPADEAEATAQVIAAHYQARAERFQGARGTAEDLYGAEGAEIKSRGRSVEMAQETPAPNGPSELFQTAYHGSPYDFDAFDTGKIGTGEGAQAYGHGLYFAEHPDVAKGYKDRIVKYSDKEGNTVDLTNDQRDLAELLAANGGDVEATKRAISKRGYAPTDRGAVLKDLDFIKDLKPTEGNLYRVDIKPEPHEFLDWDKPLSEQPDIEHKILSVLDEAELRNYERLKKIDYGALDATPPSAASLYHRVIRTFGDDKRAASQALSNVGIPGIRYLDQGSRGVPTTNGHVQATGSGKFNIVDDFGVQAGPFDTLEEAQQYLGTPKQTHNYVVFDPKDIQILDKNGKPVSQKEFELEQLKQGKILLREGKRPIITLMKTANASTFIHETGHQWLEELMQDAKHDKAPDDLKADADTVLKWFGVKSAEEIETKHHEQFARGFERYMMEGKAPHSALASVFQKFKDWLTKIYVIAARLKAPINDDIRGVFDRLITVRPEEANTAPSFADIHEADAEHIPPELAREGAQTIASERDKIAATHVPEEQDARLEGVGNRAERLPAGGQQPGDLGNAAEPATPQEGTVAPTGAIGEGGTETAQESAKARAGAERLNKAPTPLLRFIAERGGISARDELISDLRQSIGAKNRFIPGMGQLIREPETLSTAARRAGQSGAMTIDRAREAAIEAGLLPEGATISDFLDRMDHELRGHVPPEAKEGTDPTEIAHAEHNFLEGINDAVKEAGGAELSDTERERALELHRTEGLTDPVEIIERLALEADDTETAAGAPARAELIPGWDAPAAPRPAPGPGAATAPGQPTEPGGATTRAGGEAEKPNTVDPNAPLPRAESKLMDKAGNIRVENLNTPEDVSEVIRQTARDNNGFQEVRGPISDAEVLGLADAAGVDAAYLDTRKLGEAWTAPQIVALRRLLIQTATAVRDAAVKAAEGGEAEIMAYAESVQRHRMVQERVSSVTAEAGRALRAFQSKFTEGMADAKQISAIVQDVTGKTLFQLQEEARLTSALQTPSQISKAIQEANQTRWQKTRSGILSWFINNLISGPITHAGYSVGNTVTQLFKATVDTAASAAMDAIRGAAPEERVYFGEVGAQLYGMVRGMRDGFSPAITALQTGVPYMKGDVEGMIGQIEAAHRPQAIPGAVGYVMETPSRAVTAIHTMHYSMNYEAEIARRAYRSAMIDGLEPGSDAFNTKIADFTQRPPKTDMEAAHDEAMKMVLMKSAKFGTAQYHLQKAVNSNILAKIVMPFMQVGANILHEGFIERTPVGLASQTVRDNLMGRNGPIARTTQAARLSVGVGISTAVIGLTAEGILTGGGPSDPKQLAIKEMTGWRPYSIKVGESYVPYRKYLGGLGPLIAGTADTYEVGHALSEEGLTKAAAGAIFGFAEVIADESWAKGLSNFIDAARHWDRDGGRYLRNLGADFIPFSIGLQQITTLSDPYRREVRSMLDVARAHIPGLSRDLHPVRDTWGEPIESHTALGPSPANHDPATQALMDAEYYPTKIERKVRGVDLSDQQYDDLARISGRMARMRVNAMVNSPGFAIMPKELRAEQIRQVITNSREAARSMIMMQNPQIIEQATSNKIAKVRGKPAEAQP